MVVLCIDIRWFVLLYRMCKHLIYLLHFNPMVEVFVHANGWGNEGDDILLDVVEDTQVQWRFAFMFLATLRQFINE